MNTKTKKIVMTALMAALVCVATMSIRIPTPSTGGYIHPGDALVILSGVILGPLPGLLAAGIGSAMADLLGGYFIYVPITFFIKGLIAMSCGFVYMKMDRSARARTTALIICGILCTAIVAVGYLTCESFMYGFIGALASVPANIIQGLSGMGISMLLYPILFSIKEVKEIKYL